MTYVSKSKFLKFERKKERKTIVLSVVATRTGEELGEIKWFGRWKQYAFFPQENTVWNKECLDAVVWIVNYLMEEKVKKDNAIEVKV